MVVDGSLDGREFGDEWIHVYVWLSPFGVHLKLSQHCYWFYSNKKFKINKQKYLSGYLYSYLKIYEVLPATD